MSIGFGGSTVDIGDFIRMKRKSLGISQEVLCAGICTISYLSKIENKKSTGSHSTLCALLERLHTSMAEWEAQQAAANEASLLCDIFYEACVRADMDTCHMLLPQVKSLDVCEQTSLRAKLCLTLYALKSDERAWADALIAELSEVKSQFSEYKLVELWHYALGMRAYYDEAYLEAQTYFQSALQHSLSPRSHPELYFNLALICSLLHQTARSSEYLETCLDIYKSQDRLHDILDCYVLLSNNYQITNAPENIYKYLDLSLQLATRLGDSKILTKIYHGFGLYHFQREDFDNARLGFEASLALKAELGLDQERVPSTMMLALTYEKCDRSDHALVLLENMLAEGILSASTRIRFGCLAERFRFQKSGDDTVYRAEMQQAIDFFLAQKRQVLAAEYAERLAEHLANQGDFEAAYRYATIASQTHRAMLEQEKQG